VSASPLHESLSTSWAFPSPKLPLNNSSTLLVSTTLHPQTVSGVNTKVCICCIHGLRHNFDAALAIKVDYILFITADVDVTPNKNEIRDYRYVDKTELQAMFDEKGRSNCFLKQEPALMELNFQGNSFTPWFKLIARDFLFGWWDELLKRKTSDGKVSAKSLHDVADGTQVIQMA
jgi:hypothetical protein